MGIYNSDGSIATTTVDGTAWTGLYAEDGSVNVVLDDTTYQGLYHPCGALRVNSADGNTVVDSSGAYYQNTIFGGSLVA